MRALIAPPITFTIIIDQSVKEMATPSDKLNLLFMLWYHGSKSQKEAESSLESCSGNNCYMVREERGVLYLSARCRDMYSHTPIPHTQQGYVLEGHFNAFRTLQELISHHQKHSVYVDGGEFKLEVCCHKDFSALTAKYINDFNGSCIIQIREECIVIKKSNGKEMGRWPYAFIREFRFDDEKLQFSFKSGRRGVFGVADYLFKLHNRTYFNLREIVNRIAGGRASGTGTKPEPPRADDSKPPVPPHNKESSFSRKYETAYDLPAMRSVGHKRSTSNPDLTRELLRETFGGSVRSLIPNSPKSNSSSTKSSKSSESNRHSAGASTSDPNSPLLKQRRGSDYQVPRPPTENIYSVPRPYHDPHNDYQVPKPLDETYMVPRRWLGSNTISDSALLLSASKLEHRYEDPDNID